MQERGSLSLKKSIRLKKNKEFKRVYNYGKSWANKYLVLYRLEQKNNQLKVGFSVSKKIGNAVVRNKLKRQMREIFRLNKDKIKNKNASFVFIARQRVKEANYNEIEKSALDLLRRADKK
ncbi:MAG: ribonuclease P protein component [bacterium]